VTFLEALILGLVQGLTEFLPISSSGHLGLVQNLFGLKENIVTFNVIVHAGTLVAVLIFFRRELLALITSLLQALINKSVKAIPSQIPYLFIATLPAVFLSILLMPILNTLLVSLPAIGIGLIITSIILFTTDKYLSSHESLKEMNWKDSLIIGLFQALAIFPGISRSGSTVGAGVIRGLSRKTAFNFSFLLSIPVIIGALLFDLVNRTELSQYNYSSLLISFISAFISGYLALSVFKKIFLDNKLSWLGYYCLFLGVITLVFFA
jgi:undecaprenyl-diphosphatase